MRIQRLQIPAFGSFTNLELEFPSEGGDLHVIYGANEAGKSTLLRAIRDWLFGIHSQSPDNFIHDYAALRIRGEIHGRDGRQLVFQRRKGNKNTLLDADGNQLPDGALGPFLGSVDQAYFSAMFGLGTRELHDGAQQLLRGEGNIGNALFSASMGGTPVQKVIDVLKQEADRLYKGRATANVSIRPSSNRHKELLKQCRELMINPETWEQLERDLAEANAAKGRLDEELAELNRQIDWLTRCEDALPNVGRLSEELRTLSVIPKTPELATDFSERVRSARQAEFSAGTAVLGLITQVKNLETQLADCRTAPAILAEAETLDVLHQNLGAYRNHRETVMKLRSKLAGLQTSLRAKMKELGLTGDLDTLETLRLRTSDWLNGTESAKALQKVSRDCDESSGRATELKQTIRSMKGNLEARPDTDLTPLREALATAAEATDASKTLIVSTAAVADQTRAATVKHGLVTGAPADWDATARLAVPPSATIRKFRELIADQQREIAKEQSKLTEQLDGIKSVEHELARMQRRGELPSVKALQVARDHRNQGWQLVLADWKGDGAKQELVPGIPLEQAFPQAVEKADSLADQLRIQADAVAQADEKMAEIKRRAEQAEVAQQRLTQLRADLRTSQEAWGSAWATCGIQPQSPAEMEEWREAWVDFRNTLERLRAAENQAKAKSDQIDRAREALAGVLGDSSAKSFTTLFESARVSVQLGEEATGRRRTLEEQLQDHERQLATLELESAALTGALAAANANWRAQCQALKLPDDITPETGLACLAERKEVLAEFDQWRALSDELLKTAEAAAEFEREVRDKALALGLKGESVEVLEAGLWDALRRARKVQAEHDQLTGQLKKARQDLAEVEVSGIRAGHSLEELGRLAKLASPTDLEPLLANIEQRKAVQDRIDRLRETLGGLARGQAVDDFFARVQTERAEDLPQRKQRLENERAEKKPELQSIQARLLELQRKKADLEKAGDAAADCRQQAESCVAGLRQEAARYVRLRMATAFLESQIERFRKENQGPLLQKSGAVFKAITRGAFAGLVADFNADDLPVLIGLRPDQTKVAVEGLSDGSRDQLYLALRMAALDRYLEEHEPMPLILDDLLITFDDERALAILPQFNAMAKRTQVLLFTHHQHLVELCRQALGSKEWHLHQLG